MKKALSAILSIVMLFSLAVGIDFSAYAETSGDYEYEILDDGTVEINKYNGTASSVSVPSTVDGKKVTKIGSWAFFDCNSLTSVTIPNGVTSIEESAFSNCTSLTGITIPNSVTRIGGWVFYHCTSLKNINIPDSVISIGDVAFYDTAIYYNNWVNDVLYIGNHIIEVRVSEDFYIDKNIVTIADGAFDDTGVTNINVDINNKNYSSKNGVLYNKNKTELIRYPAGKADTSFTIPNTVNIIKEGAFGSCGYLKSVAIPDSVTDIGRYAFAYCTDLSKISMSKNIKNIYSDSFEGTEYYDNKSNWSDGVLYIGNCLIKADEESVSGKYSIKAGTTAIAGSAFSCCRDITGISVPGSVTSIGRYAFDACSGLTDITLSNKISSIKSGTFCGCTSLTSITIPNSVTEIEDWAFQECVSLTSITIPSSVTKIGENTFFIPYGEELVFIVEEGSYAEQYAYDNYYEYKYDINGETIQYPGYLDYVNTCEKLKDILPDSVSVNYNELDAEDKMYEIEQSIANSLKSIYTNIDTQRYSVQVSYNPSSYEYFRKASVYLKDSLNPNSWDWAEIKIVDVKFKNSDKYNKTDEQCIKNFKAPNIKYVEVDLDYLNSADVWKEFRKATIKAYEKSVNDASITVLPISRAGGGDPGFNIREGEGSYISVYKNGICYDMRRVENREAVPVINVPVSVSDKDTYNYVIQKIKETYPDADFSKKAIGIEKGFSSYTYDENGKEHITKVDYPDGYTYLFDYNGTEFRSNIFIKKECKHTWDAGKITKQPTSTATGIKTYTCTICGATKTETLPVTKLKAPTAKAVVNANGGFTISWNKISGADKYDVYYDNGTGYKLLRTVTGTSTTTGTAPYGKKYSYKVRAVNSKNSAVTSAFSAAVTATNNKKLQTPTLKATVNANGSFKLSWNKVTGAEKYELYIKQANGSYKLMKTTTSTSFTTAFATYGKQFSYKMRAVKGNTKSAYSSVVNAKNTKKLQTPTLKVTVNSNGTFKLSWNKVTGAEKYELYIKQANGSYKLMKTTTSTSFTTAFATYGKQFSYKMRAVTSKNKSAASAYSSVVNAKNTKKLQTPTLKVTVNSNGTFKLSWNKVTGAEKYELYIKQANGSYKLMKTTTSTSFTTAFATYGKQFSYKMRAVTSKNKSAASAYSSVVNAKNTKKLQTPSLKVAVNKNGSFKLSWGKVTGATSYQIYMKQSNGTYKLIKTTSSTSFTTAVAAKGKTYSYKVRAVTSKNKNATSNYSNVVSVKRK